MGDIFNTIGVLSRLDDCYPVATINDFLKAADSYSISNTPSDFNTATNKNNEVFPCGIKAMLFSALGKKFIIFRLDNSE